VTNGARSTPDMDDLGPHVAWRALEEGTPVYDRNGERVGVVEHVLAPGEIFERILIHTRPLPGRHLVAEHDQIAAIHERGVVLSVGRDELREPDERGRRRPDGSAHEPKWQAHLRRAWDWLMGERTPR
jgi:hypothetical protein